MNDGGAKLGFPEYPSAGLRRLLEDMTSDEKGVSEHEVDLFGEIPREVLERYLEGKATGDDEKTVSQAAELSPDLREALDALQTVEDEPEESTGADRQFDPPPLPLTKFELDEPDNPSAEWDKFRSRWIDWHATRVAAAVACSVNVDFPVNAKPLRPVAAGIGSVAVGELEVPSMNEFLSESDETLPTTLVPVKASPLIGPFSGGDGPVIVVHPSRRPFFRRRGVWAAIALMVAAGVGIPFVKSYFEPPAEHEVLTQAAFTAFKPVHEEEITAAEETKPLLETAIQKAEKCIGEYSGDARRLQEELEKEGAEIPVGRVGYFAKRRIFRNGLLNDVATCYWVRARSLEYLHRIDDPKADRLERAKASYQEAAKLTHGRCYDPEQDAFWNPSQKAKDDLERLASKGDESPGGDHPLGTSQE
jgi:hypothetical protein